ncbi:MAG: acyl-CoA thioesterase [Anaerohalosphaeraceae bacterium]|nr:acyl-CoA thioesterase [Anaerohalosphaeraceae bacterium]
MKFPEKTTIQSCTIPIVPRYAETDQAGVVHHSVYAVYFEMGRTELLRANGLAYKDLEASDCKMVVAELNIKFRRPAFYDEQLDLITECTRVTTARIEHTYKLIRPGTGVLLAEGTSILACVNDASKPRRVPSFLYPEDA